MELPRSAVESFQNLWSRLFKLIFDRDDKPKSTMTTRADFNRETGALEVASAFKDQIRGKNGKSNCFPSQQSPDIAGVRGCRLLLEETTARWHECTRLTLPFSRDNGREY